ncbi:MAG: hypothetical protein WAO12_02560 [Venatoribacter sp.]
MNAYQLVNNVLLAGVSLTTDGEQIIVKAKQRPDNSLVQCLKEQKGAVIIELHHRQKLWLQDIALALNVEPQRLFESGAITHADMRDCWHISPLEIAKLIRLPPEPPPTPRPSKCAECVFFHRIDHPHLGHCLKNEPEPVAGLWDVDKRHCEVGSFK